MNLGILFDLEGTLIESGYQKYPDILEKLHLDTKKMLLSIGIPRYIVNKYNKSVYLRNEAYDWAVRNFNNKELIDFKNHVENFMFKYDMFSAINSSEYHDTKNILKYLKKKNYKIGIVTNTSNKAANYILTKFNLKTYFDIIITRQDVKKIKPDPEMLIIACNRMKSKVQWIVGDSFVDIKAAKNANIKSILIKRNKNKINYQADYIINNLLDIKNIVK